MASIRAWEPMSRASHRWPRPSLGTKRRHPWRRERVPRTRRRRSGLPDVGRIRLRSARERHATTGFDCIQNAAPATRLAEGEPADTHDDAGRASRFRQREEVAHGSHVPAEAAREGIAWRHGSRTGQHRGVTGRARERPGGHLPRALGLAPHVAPGQSLGRLRPAGLCSLDLTMQRHGDESREASSSAPERCSRGMRLSRPEGSPKVVTAHTRTTPRPARRPVSAPPAPVGAHDTANSGPPVGGLTI
jgi:hypothetical protein